MPESVQNYIQIIASSNLAKTIVLFGSRARDDFRENSDFDVAVEWINHKENEILKLKAELDEKPLTLYKIDLLDINTAGSEYLKEIQSEGKIIWQKKD